MSTPSPFSQHPADQLIRELVRARRPASPAEVQQIRQRLATAPFDTSMVPVKLRYRGLAYQGRTLGNRADALFLHLALRVVEDEQWTHGTTEDDYLADLREAALAPAGRVTVFERRGGAMAAIWTPNHLPPHRRGRRHRPWLFVVYSADRGIVVSGYQASGLHAVSLPGDALWLV